MQEIRDHLEMLQRQLERACRDNNGRAMHIAHMQIHITHKILQRIEQQQQTTTPGDTDMIDVKDLTKKALAGDERAHRLLISRYGKVTTAQLLRDAAKEQGDSNADND
jgi:hypothetical protein